MLTQERLKEALAYNRDTGEFVWRISLRGHTRVGNVAGTTSVLGYRHIMVDRKLYYAHRLAFLFEEGVFPTRDVDHINGRKDDNRWVNLRHATRSENLRNQKKFKNNTSGYKGVSPSSRGKKWVASGRLGGKQYYLGVFSTPAEASVAYERFAADNYGRFYCPTEK